MKNKENSPFNSVFSFIKNQKDLEEKKAVDVAELRKIQKWYTELMDNIKRKPPKKNVKCLEIDENCRGEICDIRYHYSDSNLIKHSEILIQINSRIKE